MALPGLSTGLSGLPSLSSGSAVNDYQALEEEARPLGYEPKLQEEKRSVLQRLFGLLNAAETGDAIYEAMTGGDPLKTYGKDVLSGVTLQGDRPEKKTYEDVLELVGVPEGKMGPISGRSVAGIGLDILLDPTTYVGGALAKGAGKGVRGIGKVAAKVGRGGVDIGAKIPKIGGAIEQAGEAVSKIPDIVGKNLIPGFELKKVLGDEAWDAYNQFVKKTRSEQIKMAKRAGEVAKKFGATGQDQKLLIELLEGKKGLKTTDDVLKIASEIRDTFRKWAKTEKEWGLLKKTRDDYVPHFLTKAGRELLRKGQLNTDVFKPLRAVLGSARPRKIMGTINEINARYAAEIGDPTFKLFDDDIFRIMANRGVDSVRAIETKRFIDEVGQKWGIHEKKAIEEAMKYGRYTQDGITYIPYKPEGALRFFQGVLKPGEEVLYQLKNLTQGRSFEEALMQTGKLIEAAEESGIAVAKNNRLRTALGNFVGNFRTGKGQIGLKSINPITAAHEYGHAIDWIYGAKTWRRMSTDFAKRLDLMPELARAGREYQGVGTGKPAEQFAEFFRQYILDNKTVEKEFPQLSKAVKEEMAKMPGITKRIDSVRKFANKVDKLVPRAKLSKSRKGMPRWQQAMWQEDPEAMKYLQKSLGLILPEKEYLGVTKKVPTYLLPEPMANHMNNAYKFLTNDEDIRQLVRMYDKTLNFWKGTVTGIFPAFHARNLIGGMFNNWLGGVKNPGRYLQARKIVKGLESGDVAEGTIKLGKKTWKYSEIRELMAENGVVGQAGMIDVQKTIAEHISPRTGLAGKIPTPRGVMGAVENELRATMFIDRLAKGDEPWDAAKKVITYHFDYMPEGLTHFERQTMKRIIPFYTWTRNNIPLQLRSAYQQPGKYGAVGKTLRGLGGPTAEQRAELSNLPEFISRGYPIRLGEEDGKVNYAYNIGMPFEDITKLGEPEYMLSQMSPLLKVPLETATGRSFFFQGDLPKNAPQLLSKAPKPMKDWLEYSEYKNKAGETKRTLNPKKWNVVAGLLSRGFFTANKVTDPDTLTRVKALYLVSGVSTREYDIEEQKGYREKQRTREVQDFLEQRGLLYKGEYYGRPK